MNLFREGTSHMIIAIDGPSSSGKGTIARLLGEKLNFAVLETGLLYRLLGYLVLESGGNPENKQDTIKELKHITEELLSLHAPVLREDRLAKAASIVAQYKEVREALLFYQRFFAKNPPSTYKGSILDGRDIGTVVCPNAEIKFFITATPEIRAKRRWKELQERGIVCMFDDVLRDLKERDMRDTTRSISPLTPASDAIVLDTSEKTPDEILNVVLHYVSQSAHSR